MTKTTPKITADFDPLSLNATNGVTTNDPSTNLFEDPTQPPSKFRAIRSQADNLQDQISRETGFMPDGESMTRQEFKDETDIDFILRRFNGTRGRTPQFEDNSFNLDLQTALHAREMWNSNNVTAPDELKAKYPNAAAIMHGLENGQYQKDLEELRDRKSAEAEQQAIRDLSKGAPPPEPPKGDRGPVT